MGDCHVMLASPREVVLDVLSTSITYQLFIRKQVVLDVLSTISQTLYFAICRTDALWGVSRAQHLAPQIIW